MSHTIIAATPQSDRRFDDSMAFGSQGRVLSCNPGSGTVLIKHKIGAAYITMLTVDDSSADKALFLATFDVAVEIECTGDAQAELSNVN